MNLQKERDTFEMWIIKPPIECDVSRWSKEESVWPGQYKNYPVQLAWEAWLARSEVT